MYNEAEICDVFFERVIPVLSQVTKNFEIVCVNDGSRDETREILLQARAKEPRIKIINLTRNFGKELALTAGIDYASGDAVIPIDADLQDPPELIPKLIERWLAGYDMVIAVRSDRSSDSFLKRITAGSFYRIAERIADTPITKNAGDFRLLDRSVVRALQALPERTRFMKGLFSWVGFSRATVEFSRQKRELGKSKWKYWKLWNFALEGIFSFTTLPLRIWMYLGFSVALVSGMYIAFIILRTLFMGVDVPGYASLIVTMLFFSGLNMIGLGILGEYIGRIFLEVKQRPLYLVGSVVGIEPIPGSTTTRTQSYESSDSPRTHRQERRRERQVIFSD
jgi:glycosyltransferase involved in cell wall biosynthesis